MKCAMIESFKESRIDVGHGTHLAAHTGGHGAPVLLLHGYPQTHLIWRHLAPRLAQRFSVVAPDVKGYGASDAPSPLPDASNYSKRTLAADCVALMRALGHERFAVIGHDRGGRIAYRMAFDHASVVSRIVTLDIVPTGAMWASLSKRSAVSGFHWSFLAQPDGFPERLIGADSDYFLRTLVTRWAGDVGRIGEPAMAEYCRAFARPEVIRASCADYRAGATIDDELDAADLAANRRFNAPLMAIWSERFTGQRQSAADPLEIWRRYAADVRGFPVACGHFIPEEAPEAVVDPITQFLA
jgi:haloacetate dehalogenase